MSKPDLASIIAAVTQPGAPVAAPSGDASAMTMMMAMMQQQREESREAARAADARAEREDQRRREEKAEMNKMLLALGSLILPKLLDKPALDPFVIKMMESSSNKDMLKDFITTSSALNQQASQMMMQQMTTAMGTMGDMQSRMTERQIDMMEERVAKLAAREDDDAEEKSPFLDIVRAVLPSILGDKAKIGEAVVSAVATNQPTKPAANPAPAVTTAIAAPVAAPVPPSPVVARKIRLMQLCMALHLRGATFDEAKRQQFLAAIVNTVARSDDVARAIMGDDQAGLLQALQPAVAAEPPLGQWIGSTAAQIWVGGLISETIKPGLLAVAREMQRRKDERDKAQATPAEPETLGPENVAKA